MISMLSAGPLVQRKALSRALASGPEGQRSESPQPTHKVPILFDAAMTVTTVYEKVGFFFFGNVIFFSVENSRELKEILSR